MPEPKKPLTKPAAGAKQTAARSAAATAKAKPARSATPKTTAARTNAAAKPATAGTAKAPATRKPRVSVPKPEAAAAVASVSNPPAAAVPEAMPSTAATQEETLRIPEKPDLASSPVEASPEPATDAAPAQPADPQTEWRWVCGRNGSYRRETWYTPPYADRSRRLRAVPPSQSGRREARRERRCFRTGEAPRPGAPSRRHPHRWQGGSSARCEPRRRPRTVARLLA